MGRTTHGGWKPVCAGGMKDMRQHFDWPAGLIDRVSSQMQCKKEKLSERISLTPRMYSNTRAWMEEDRERERDRNGKGKVVEAQRQEKQVCTWKVSGSYPQTCWEKACEGSMGVTLPHSSTTTLEEPFSSVLNTRLPLWSCSVANSGSYSSCCECDCVWMWSEVL